MNNIIKKLEDKLTTCKNEDVKEGLKEKIEALKNKVVLKYIIKY